MRFGRCAEDSLREACGCALGDDRSCATHPVAHCGDYRSMSQHPDPIASCAPEGIETASQPQLLWSLRMVAKFKRRPDFVSRVGYAQDDLAEWMGLGHLVESTCAITKRRALRDQLQRFDTSIDLDDSPACLRTNSGRIAELVGLSSVERRILEFAILLHLEPMLRDAASHCGQMHRGIIPSTIATILALPEADVRMALRVGGALARSGLVSISPRGSDTLDTRMELLSSGFADAMMGEVDDPVSLLRHAIVESPLPSLHRSDFEHVEKTLSVLEPYLSSSMIARRRGVNVLVHGRPGTGKTELARWLAKAFDCPLFEVASEDANGELLDAERRLQAYRAAQAFLAHRHALILFDEVEDVFNGDDHPLGRKSLAQARKAWMNRLLEDNGIPTIWLTNRVRGMDAAFVRRFDVVMEMSLPARSQRKRVIETHCRELVTELDSERLADCAHLAPAVLVRASRVVNAAKHALTPGAASSGLTCLVDSTLKAQGHLPLAVAAMRLPAHYSPDCLNVDADVRAIAAGIRASGCARLCLFGPPGTGKSALGLWLAQELDRPLIHRKVSDILGMFVGESEANIASAFREAHRDGAVLMVDEVDSFLADRRNARRSWEATLVNEMLSQMEQFEGVFIASTNLMEGLDQAALRRFDLKLRFGYLKPEQAHRMLASVVERLALPGMSRAVVDAVARLQVLTPGDFAAIARRHRFSPLRDAKDLASALRDECLMKEDGRRGRMGFV